jgi:hypothetical protein
MIGDENLTFDRRLREKWREIPATRQDRTFSSDLLDISDQELLEYWDRCRAETCTPEVRGWYQERYAGRLSHADVADIGPGIGLDGIWFAQHGARVTFVDIVEDNLALLRRLCGLKGIDADFYFIDDFFNYRFAKTFDCFLCVGSLINAPFDFTKRQVAALTPFLRVGGIVLMLGYPRERFEDSGARDGAEFAVMTDGARTPWAEWYDDEKVRALFGPQFRLEWSRNFGHRPIDFNWFELTKINETTPVREER